MSIASRINEMTEHLRKNWDSINKLGLKTKKLPDEYRQVEYIESSGTQYIDTGFAPNQNTRTVIDFMPTSAGSLFIFGSRLGYNNNAYDLYTFANKFRDDYANTNYGNNTSENFPKVENKRYLFDKNKNHSIMYEENVQFYDHTFNGQTINLSFNMFLFGVNSNGSIASSNMAKMKLYSCKIYDNDILVRDFVPCYRINDVKVGLYDTINDVFYTNQGTGVFTYGEIQEEIPNKNIKNIASVLDRFYNQLSDKTNLSENGIVGRTSQESTTGKNLLDTSLLPLTKNGITITKNDKGEIVVDGTPNISSGYITFQVGKTSTSELTTYTSSIDNKRDGLGISIGNGNINLPMGETYASKTFTFNYTFTINPTINIRYDAGTFDNVVINPQLEKNTTKTDYEPYTGGEPSPSPDYPQEVNNLSGDVEYKVRGKNLFDISNNSKSIHSTIETSGNIISGDTLRITNIAEGAYRYYFIPLTNVEFVLGKTITLSVKASLYGATSGQIRFMWASNTWYTTALGNPTNFTSNGTYTCTVEVPSDIPSGSTRLCAGLYSSGTTSSPINSYVDYSDIQVEVGLTSTPYEPYISESFPLSLKSKNLFDKDNANVLVGCINAGAKIISEQNDRIIYIPCKPNTTYVLQKMVQEPLRMNRFRVATSEAEPTYGMIVNQYYNPGDGKNIEKYIITTNDRANYLIFYCYYTLNNTVTFEEILDSIQIEEGSTPTTYEPYYDINLCNISNYKDRIYSQNGEFYLGKKTVKVVLDGTETWNFGNAGATNINGASTIITDMMTSSYGDGYSNYFVNKKSGKDAYTIRFGANNNTLYFYVNNNEFSNVDIWKTWLSTHNTEVEYVLATPTYTKITEENYPTLYSQLLAIQEFLTKYKINKEFLLNYSSPEIEY